MLCLLHLDGAWLCLAFSSWPKATSRVRARDLLTEPYSQCTVLRDFHLRGCCWSWLWGYNIWVSDKGGICRWGFACGKEGLFQGASVGFLVCKYVQTCAWWVHLLVRVPTLCFVKLLCCTMGLLLSQHPVSFMPVYMVCAWRYGF